MPSSALKKKKKNRRINTTHQTSNADNVSAQTLSRARARRSLLCCGCFCLFFFLTFFFFFFNDTATTEIYTLSLHDALPISFIPPADRPVYRARDPDECV